MLSFTNTGKQENRHFQAKFAPHLFPIYRMDFDEVYGGGVGETLTFVETVDDDGALHGGTQDSTFAFDHHFSIPTQSSQVTLRYNSFLEVFFLLEFALGILNYSVLLPLFLVQFIAQYFQLTHGNLTGGAGNNADLTFHDVDEEEQAQVEKLPEHSCR